jgi:hypothetical protein
MVRDSLTDRLDPGVGDQDDAPGIALEVTTNDIDDIAYEPGVSVEERRGRLQRLHAELVSRRSADMMGDMQELIDMVTDRLSSLENPIEADTGFDSIGLDPDTRRDDDDPADYIDEAVFTHDLTGAPLTETGEDVTLTTEDDDDEDIIDDADIDHAVEDEEAEALEDEARTAALKS